MLDPVGMTPTLLIVDDHPEFRNFARMLLDAEGFAVVGEAADGESALDAVRAQRPDVVLVDVQLPGIDGFEVARHLAASEQPPQVVLTSSRERSDYGSRLADQVFLPKRELSGEALLGALA
jgi:CheY-like chemotaxis protein